MVNSAARAGRYTCSVYVPGYIKTHWAAVVEVDNESTAAWNYIRSNVNVCFIIYGLSAAYSRVLA